MLNLKQYVSVVALTTALLAAVPSTGASALQSDLFQIKSVSATDKCIDVKGRAHVAGTSVGIYPCNTSDPAQKIYLETGSMYYKDGQNTARSFCIGDSDGKAVLQNCLDASTDMAPISLNGGAEAFKFPGGILSAPSNPSSTGFTQMVFTPGKHVTSNAEEFTQVSL